MFTYKIKDLIESLQEYDLEMEVISLDEKGNVYNFDGLGIDRSEDEPRMGLRHS